MGDQQMPPWRESIIHVISMSSTGSSSMKHPAVSTSFGFVGNRGTNAYAVDLGVYHGLLREAIFIAGGVKASFR